MRFLLACALIGIAFAKVDYSGHKVYRAFPTVHQNELIKKVTETQGFDVWSDYKHENDFVDLRVQPELQTKIEIFFRRNKIAYEILIEDVGFAIERMTSPRQEQMSLQSFDYNKYHTFDEIDTWSNYFTEDNNLATQLHMGISYDGILMKAIKISTGSDRRAFVINCGIHAREWVSPATCIYTAKMLMDKYNQNSTVTTLMNSVDFYLIPSSNPDGYIYTWSNDRMWRKTRSDHPGCRCTGVDPNRNFDYKWDGPGSSKNCCSETYRGPSAFSEVETVNQKTLVESIHNVRGYIDIHSYSQMWMYPYGWTTNPAPDDELLGQIGKDSVAAIKSAHGMTYQTGSIANVIYIASGSTADYFYNAGVKCSWAAELRDTGKYGFLLPENLIQPTAEETFEGLMVIAQYIANGKCD